MIYLDYSATTKVSDEVLSSFCKVEQEYIGNANSLHQLGFDAKKLMEKAVSQVAHLLSVKEEEVIFTSSASEANNMVLKGVLAQYKNRGCHIITTKLEHSSILDTCTFLEKQGIEVSYVPVLENGKVDEEMLKKMIRKDTVLVSIHAVNSEVGIVQDISRLALLIHEKNPLTFFHVDGTQAVGKIPVCLESIDLFTFSAHKIYGLKGIACLIKKRNVGLVPLIHGGKSQSEFRSGTPSVSLMVSLAKALRLALDDLFEKKEKVKKLNAILREELLKIDGVTINSPEDATSYILNLSVFPIKPEVMLHALEQEGIYLSTKTACRKDSGDSISLLAMGKPHEICGFSLRISLSYLTTEEEIRTFLKIFQKKIKELNFRK